MDVSAKSMDDSAKNDERFGQKIWTFRPNIYLIVLQRQMTHTIENSHLDILLVVCYDHGAAASRVAEDRHQFNFAEKSRQQYNHFGRNVHNYLFTHFTTK